MTTMTLLKGGVSDPSFRRTCKQCRQEREWDHYPYTGDGNARRYVCDYCEPLFTNEELDGFKAWLDSFFSVKGQASE